MSTHIITLFGEEIIPEELNAAAKVRQKRPTGKRQQEKEADNNSAEEQVTIAEIKNESPLPPMPEAVNAPVGKVSKKEINLPDDWNGEKQYYSIGEVAELFKVKTSHIRFWTNEFAIKVRTTRKGDRLYTPTQVKEIKAIYHLVKERGFTLSGAKAKLKSQNKLVVETVDLKESLLHLRNKLLVIRNQII